MKPDIHNISKAVTLLLLCCVCTFPARSKTVEKSFTGEILTFRITDSQIYPGTERTITVYVPERYTGMAPACLLVRMDRLEEKIYADIDKLIADGKMPVTIAVGIEPGKVRREGSVIRYNRSNEFDRTDSKLATFLEQEVLPRVEKLVTSNGRSLVISSSTFDRAITGVSSGAIAAFAVAWNRPDMFSRVYSVIGTYMPFRGADQFPGIIRKTEPKALRIYFQDNDEDCWNPLFGSWFEENNRMYNALEFAGYDVMCHWDKGGHDNKNGLKYFYKAMEWLWRDYRNGIENRITKGKTGNATIETIVVPEEKWVIESEKLYGEVKVVKLTASSRAAGIQSAESDDAKEAAHGANGENDGSGPLTTAIYPGGTMKATLAKEGDRWISQWTKGINDEWENSQEYYALHGGAYGPMVYDIKGYLYVATETGIEICDHNGRVRAILSYPARLMYGLPESRCNKLYFKGNILYIEFEGTLWHRKLKVSGFEDAYSVPAPERENEG